MTASSVSFTTREYLKYLLRVAARKHKMGALSDALYGAFVTRTIFQLAGKTLQHGDSYEPVRFWFAVQKAFRLPTAYNYTADPVLMRLFGPLGAAPEYLKNNTGDYTWGTMAHGLYDATLSLVKPLPRLEAWLAATRNRYRNLTGMVAWLISIVIAVIATVIGGLVTRLLTCPK